CLQTPLLFLGPLDASYLASALPGKARYSLERDFLGVFFICINIHNYVLVSVHWAWHPSCCTGTAHRALGGAARWKMIVVTPLVFGLAHVHHAWETYSRHGRSSALKRAAASTHGVYYTTLFGVHASFLFLRTASIVPPLTAHVFCNIMGVPQIGAELHNFPARKNGASIRQSRVCTDAHLES
ncbi:hypothetical protein C8R44DRAFT_602127, partial [Mycena epipterygia]